MNKKLKRIIFDTSVYGELILRPEFTKKIVKEIQHQIIVYGNKIIRNELRSVSKKAKIEGKSKRIFLLKTYDFITQDHELKVTELVDFIANSYYKEFRKLGGNISKRKIFDDFRIIASASIHSLDIVVSHDEKSMLAKNSIKCYKNVNDSLQLRNPDFITFKKFMRLL